MAHEVDYEIIGTAMPAVEIELDADEAVIAEAGAMTYMEDDIEFETKLGDGADPDQGMFGKMFSAGKRMLTGESLFMTHFTNSGNEKRRVAFAAPYPGTIVPVDMASCGNSITLQKDSFICAAKGTKVDMAFNKRLGAGFFGGEGFILQKLSGDGMAFVHAGGSVIKKELNGGTLRVDTGCLVGFTDGIDFDIALSSGLKSMIFGGEGIFMTTLSGHGTVWLQSLPFSRMADAILAHAPKAGGSDKGES